MRLIKTFSILSILLFGFLFVGCDAITPQDGDLVDYSCEGCHTNKGTLDDIIDVLVLDPPVEGHEAPG